MWLLLSANLWFKDPRRIKNNSCVHFPMWMSKIETFSRPISLQCKGGADKTQTNTTITAVANDLHQSSLYEMVCHPVKQQKWEEETRKNSKTFGRNKEDNEQIATSLSVNHTTRRNRVRQVGGRTVRAENGITCCSDQLRSLKCRRENEEGT